MRPARVAPFLVTLASLACLLPPARVAARAGAPPPARLDLLTLRRPPRVFLDIPDASYHAREDAGGPARVEPSGDDRKGGIKEIIPTKYLARYREWKKEFLATETGRGQWEMFDRNPNFTLTIAFSRANSRGAGTGEYKWDDSGKLVAATITLGPSLDKGYPNPIYFPVMNSLAPDKSFYLSDTDVLAAAKLAHEFGHVTRTANSDAEVYQLQSRLMPVYNKILLDNGRNVDDPRLVDLERQMGGTPVAIWEDREYWGETYAMLYLSDRFAGDDLRCTLFGRIKQSVNLYAKGYTERFLNVARSNSATNGCGWQ